jgi:CBS domain-containing protein
MARKTAQVPVVEGSYTTPSFETASVFDAMRHGVLTCLPETPLRVLARMMAQNHVHSVIVTGVEGKPTWGMISDTDLLRSADQDLDTTTAGQIAGTELVTVAPYESLAHAAQLMAEHDVTHVLVVDSQADRPVGVVSSLDVAGIMAWGRA